MEEDEEEEGPLVTTVPRGGVFSLTRLERCGDRTVWEEDETSYADTFLDIWCCLLFLEAELLDEGCRIT